MYFIFISNGLSDHYHIIIGLTICCTFEFFHIPLTSRITCIENAIKNIILQTLSIRQLRIVTSHHIFFLICILTEEIAHAKLPPVKVNGIGCIAVITG